MSDSILPEAGSLIAGDRNAAYGPAPVDYARTVDIFRSLTGHQLTAAEGCLFMVSVKLSREAHRHARDNLVDAAAYLELYRQCLESVSDLLPADQLR